MRPYAAVLASALFLVSVQGASAQGPPINTDTAFVNGLQGAAFRSFVFSVNRSGLVRDGQSSVDPLDQEVSILTIPIIVPYEVVKNRLDLMVGIPVVHKRMAFTKEGQRQELTNAGFGDLFLGAKYLFLQRDAPGKTTRMAAVGGIKFPTGEDDETDAQGNTLPRPLQLGTGSVDHFAGVVITHVVRRIGLNADLIYNFNTEANGFAFGDKLRYDFALGYRLSPGTYKVYPAKQWNVYLEWNGEFAQRDKQKGMPIPDSGGHIAFLSPGIQFIPYSTFLVEASVRIPVLQNLNGMQLKFHPALMVGIRSLLF